MAAADTGPDGAPETGPRERGRGRRWMTALLVVSLSANLLVAGVFIGQMARSMMAETPRLMRGERIMLRVIPEAYQQELRAAIKADRPVVHGVRVRMHRANLAIIAAVKAEPYDPTALDQAFSERLRLRGELQRNWHRRLRDYAGRMSVEERLELAARLKRMTVRWAARHGLAEAAPAARGGRND
ncbi:MAG: periplasmic heavy metal sensor [Pseudomonadota bacterium]